MATPRIRSRALVVLATAAALLLVGCRQDMHDQAKYEPLEASALFSDGAASRVPPAFTVARGTLDALDPFHTGVGADGSWLVELPVELDAALLARGRERFDIYCSPCHDRLGTGRGMIVRRGFSEPPTYHQDRLRLAPVGYLFDVASNGYGRMSGYRAQVGVHDRWAIAAWIRVLQRSQLNPTVTLSAEDRQRVAEGWVDPRVAPAPSGHGEHAGDSGDARSGDEAH
ncbi:MAG TPA: cytochrome c [Thermoanaerobaculia bacterium]|nr:cytochrome c [Thermoanaerobaculia bacterium]